ncbi:formin-binding protein 1-like isoform X2 [Mugil cephalus]|uniref:formin-binding protein 1-like isoform X2 n=1 Tax=Mugil cephalus TaxID=48193 RepID=UPI001FB7805C|nr:formin-binding protein 1-like isoform X2 [Mugil cephalus]
MSWGTELWDQFDNLDKHTQWGIDFLERYAKFVKERLDIEQNYAKQLRNLVKKYCPKRSKDEEPRFTSCLSFYSILNELNDYAGQREVVAEEMAHKVYGELMRYSQDLKAERKHHLQEGRKAQQHLDHCWKMMDNSKKKFERECREAEKSQITYERLDNDINATKSEVEKAKNQFYARTHMADESKNEYAAQLQDFNAEQWKHFNNAIPHIFKNLQDMDQRRTVKLGETYRCFAEAERRVIPIISKCLEGMVSAAKAVDDRRDSVIVIESFKSGFDPPGDYPFEDFSQNLSRTGSDGTISKGDRERERDKDGTPGPRSDPKHQTSRTKNKLWLFGKKPKSPSSSPPPPPPPSSSSRPRPTSTLFPSSRFNSDAVSHYFSEIKTSVPRIPQNLRGLRRGAPSLEDFSHLPPEQRRKRLQQRIDELSRELQKEMDQRDALNKMKDVYEKNPQMGDPVSLQPKISETICNMEKLRSEIHKNETWLSEVEGKQSSRGDRRHSADNHHHTPQGRESPEGSYTDDTSQEHHTPHHRPSPARPGQPTPHDPHEFDDEFDDDDPLPIIGHCKALYSFDGQNEGTLVMAEDEVLYIIEEDKGDGWTRARKQSGEEGYVPTSYVEITLEKNSKGS